MARIDDQLAALATMSPAELQVRWQEVFGEEAPPLPVSLLRRAIAYEMQEQAYGGLPAAAERMLDAIARDPAAPPEKEVKLKVGTRLLREWNGKLHAVLVIDEGLLFEERRYGSLSEVARTITGAHWSGPRFFGLKRAPMPPPREGAHG